MKKSKGINKNLIESEKQETRNGVTVKVLKLKTKKSRSKNNARNRIGSCPNCLSTLKITSEGIWDCTGDKLTVWVDQFKNFEQMDEKLKADYLTSLSNSDRFLELYDKWLVIDILGNRTNFNCGYTNKLFPPLVKMKNFIHDPIFVKNIELKLGRKLTPEELSGETNIWEYKGKLIFKKKEGAVKVKIPIYNLPEDDV